jgi:GTP cyclohydrolase IB
MSVSLDAETRGAHLSRFVEVLHGSREQMGVNTAVLVADELRTRMRADRARISMTFPYFLDRAAPATGAQAFVEYECGLSAMSSAEVNDLIMRVEVPVTSVCPCSKAISDRGAHNQRGWITIEARPSGEDAGLWFDDLIDVAEAAASSPVYALLKRPDERHVTMAGYDNPMFVEDMVRDVARALDTDPRVAAFQLSAVNDESIHNHNAYAKISWRDRALASQ